MTSPGIPLWSVGPGRLPTLHGEAHADACVVGLGASGLAATRRLIQAGRRVIAIDRGGVAAGAAGRNGGFMLAGPAEFHHRLAERVGADAACAFYEMTVEARDRMLRETPGARINGSLRRPATEEEASDCRAQLEALRAGGFRAEWVNAPAGGLLIPGDASFDPAVRARALADQVADRSRLLGGTRVTAIEPEAVHTEHGTIRAETIIVCVDGGLERIFPELEGAEGGRPSVRSLRLQMLATAPATDVVIERAIYHRFGYDYWQQRPDGRIALGGGRDLGGEEEETTELGTSDEVQRHLERLLREVIQTRAEVTHRWSGIVAYSSDHLPVVETLAPGVFAAGAYSGHGNVLGVMAGEALADLAVGRPTPSLVRWLGRVRA